MMHIQFVINVPLCDENDTRRYTLLSQQKYILIRLKVEETLCFTTFVVHQNQIRENRAHPSAHNNILSNMNLR